MAVRDVIERRLRINLARVSTLVEVAARDHAGAADVLRAAVVLLHATLEDTIRTLLEWRWPAQPSAELLDGVALFTGRTRRRDQKFTLADLLTHRGRSVDDVIRLSIEAHLERSNFNNPGDVKTALARCGLEPRVVEPFAPRLSVMMLRRHQIVHRADYRVQRDAERQAPEMLTADDVREWFQLIESLCTRMLAAACSSG